MLASAISEDTWRRVDAFVQDVARTIDDDQLERFPSFFASDGVYKIVSRFNVERGLPLSPLNCTGRGMIVDRITSLRQANIFPEHRYRHVVGGAHIVPTDDDRVVAVRSSYICVRIMADGTSTLFSSGEYRDRIRVDLAESVFLERIVVFDSRSIDTVLVIPL